MQFSVGTVTNITGDPTKHVSLQFFPRKNGIKVLISLQSSWDPGIVYYHSIGY